ncbi:hypothetical protein ABT56_08285 [Photobacterium aquae]|uniref:Anti-sigma-28 factor FlgM C-terminal domain-containing protein n=1 Tax=Photobacterium aquae TaxID=1195763 RepID=A0A0J1JWD8_9GAMM|nr:flagellar biosynthesis anti-sigma factor FlgM [Photobacterium aquae]KLV06612.1 hypothetical protein ABT56_08285 [Photobacterium aquae]
MIGKVTFNTQPTLRPTSAAEAKPASDVAPAKNNLSPMQQAKHDAAQHSDVDMDKVAAAKALLRSRDNSVNLDSLADKMLDFYQGDA